VPVVAPAFTLSRMPYPYDGLEPAIDARTMQIHHGKPFQAYVDNLDRAVAVRCRNRAFEGTIRAWNAHMTYQLVPPNAVYERSYADYIRELRDEERYPFPLDYEHDDFPALLQRLDDLARGINVPEGFVPSSTFWLVQGNVLVGVSNLRHTLNNRIRHMGGHIGLGIRPSSRGGGLGNLLLCLTIAEARRRGIEPIHIHCHKDNAASVRMILSNGGLLESEVPEPGSDHILQRYVVSGVR